MSELLAVDVEPWEADALCREHPDLPWVPDLGQDITPAKAVCARCAVRSECLAFALERGPSLPGVWGGTGTVERRKMLAAAKRQ